MASVLNAWAYIEAAEGHPTEAAIARLTHRSRRFVRTILARLTRLGLMTKGDPVYRNNRLQYVPRRVSWDLLPTEPIRTSTREPIRAKSLSITSFQKRIETSKLDFSPTGAEKAKTTAEPVNAKDLRNGELAEGLLEFLQRYFVGASALFLLLWASRGTKRDPGANRFVRDPRAYVLHCSQEFYKSFTWGQQQAIIKRTMSQSASRYAERDLHAEIGRLDDPNRGLALTNKGQAAYDRHRRQDEFPPLRR